MAELDHDALLAVLDELPVGVALFRPEHDDDGRVVDLRFILVNRELRRVMGDVTPPVHLSERVPDRISQQLFDRYLEVVETGTPFQARIGTSDFVLGTFDVHACSVAGLLLVQAIDVTEAAAVEAVQQEAQRRIAETLERIDDAVVALDADWCFTFVNEEAGRRLGRAPEDLVGRNAWEAFPEAVGTRLERYARQAMTTGKPVSFEVLAKEPFDSWFLIRIHPSDDGLTVFFQDIGAHRRMEERAAVLERLESAATMASAVAHDFNTLLMLISGHASLVGEALPADHERQEDLAAIREATDRAAELTKKLLTFSRTQDLRVSVVELNEVVGALEPLLRQALPSTVHLEVQPAEDPVLVEVDRSGLERALLHLAANSAQAMPGGGEVTVVVGTWEVDSDDGMTGSDLAHGLYGTVAVADNGTGMTEAVRRRVLEPFFSTRRDAGATGLGLPAVHGVARHAGGQVVIESVPDEGTTVTMVLPRAATD